MAERLSTRLRAYEEKVQKKISSGAYAAEAIYAQIVLEHVGTTAADAEALEVSITLIKELHTCGEPCVCGISYDLARIMETLADAEQRLEEAERG